MWSELLGVHCGCRGRGSRRHGARRATDDGHTLGGELGAGLGLEGRSQAVGLGQCASISASSWASVSWCAPGVKVSYHGPASATRAGERLSQSRATARGACSIDPGGHPLVTTASLMTTAR